MTLRKIALLSLITLLALPAAAWTKKDNCNGGWVRWRLSDETLNVSAGISQFYTAEWRRSIDAAQNAWTYHAPASNFEIWLNWTLGTVNGVSGDTKDDLALGSSSNWIYGDFAAITKHRKSDCGMWPDLSHYNEVDVLVNPDAKDWDKSTNPVPSDTMRNTTLILLHEFGHVMGLGEETRELATMNTGFPGPGGGPLGNNNDVHPLGDDIAGLRAGYGDPGAGERDVAASAVRFVSAGVSKVIAAPPATFRGSSVSFQFTVVNRSRTNIGQETIPVYFYLSPTRYTTPSSGLFLGSTTIKLNDTHSTTGWVSLNIPMNAPTGNQYLGWYLDPANGIPETEEQNNGVALVSPTYISPNRVPGACFTATPTSGYAPLRTTFDAGCSSDPDGDALTYHWDFGDGMTGSGPTATNYYFSQGTYQVVLTVTDPSGAVSQTYRYISVACTDSRFCAEEPY